jgi:ParB-like chromosome segregation protein Spo0J
MGSKSSGKLDIQGHIPLDPAVTLQKVRLNKVDLADDTFRITTCTDLDKLVLSIQKLGLLQPPVLKYKPTGYAIVCGFRRIAACLSLGWDNVWARILKENFNHLELAQLTIADNASQRSLNLLETSRAVKLLNDACTDQKQLKKAFQDLDLPYIPAAEAKVIKLCQLPLKIQEGILADTINMSMALELGKLDTEAGEALVELFGLLKVGLNKQRELLLLLKEIARREDISIPQLIAEKAFQKILQNDDLDRAVKRQKIRRYLRQRRFPSISRAEEKYEKLVKQLKLGSHINLIPPKDFEGMTYMMTLRFDNHEELHQLKEKFEKIIHHPSLGKILER